MCFPYLQKKMGRKHRGNRRTSVRRYGGKPGLLVKLHFWDPRVSPISWCVFVLCIYVYNIPSSKRTWQWKFTVSNRKYIFKWWIFRSYVSLPEGIMILHLDTHTVDGQNPAPVEMVIIPLFTRFYTYQVVQDFVHQQYVYVFQMIFPALVPFSYRVSVGCRCKGQKGEFSTVLVGSWRVKAFQISPHIEKMCGSVPKIMIIPQPKPVRISEVPNTPRNTYISW